MGKMVTKTDEKLFRDPEELPDEADQVFEGTGRQSADGFLVKKRITLAAATTSYDIFLVTGLVAVKVIGYVKTALTNHADTVSVGTTTSAAGLIAATAGTALQTAGQSWVDNAPSKFETLPANFTIIGNGEDIKLASTVNIVAGVIDFYCWYKPIEAGSALVAA
jgi:hypothetical protein